METSLTIDYDKQWLNCVSAIGPWCFVLVANIYFKIAFELHRVTQPQLADRIEHEKINSIFPSVYVLFCLFHKRQHEQSKLGLNFYCTQRR